MKKKNLVLAKFELETETRKKCQDYLYFLILVLLGISKTKAEFVEFDDFFPRFAGSSLLQGVRM